MRHLLVIFTLLFFALSTSFGQTQKLPIQGKLFESDVPVSGTRNFTFTIPAVGWNQGPISVQVNNGLYATELDVPTDLFATNNSLALQIAVEGVSLPPVMLYAPIEKDPTVLESVKDGVSWDEVTDKPAMLDLDDTNELQSLELSGNTLTISGGNSVELSTSSGTGSLDTLTVGEASLESVVVAESLQGTSTQSLSSVSQTFFASEGGRLTALEIECSNLEGANISFTVKKVGQSQAIASNFFLSNIGPSLDFQNFEFTQSNPILEDCEDYIIEITVAAGSQMVFRIGDNNPYPFGQSDIDPQIDLKFRVTVETTVGPSLQVDENGFVGIGTNEPTSMLTVNGRIEDETGFLMPVGSILPYAGPANAPPKGWLICDGEAVSQAKYADLFNVIGTNWGADAGDPTRFRLPDLRGEFIRGWSGASDRDPEKNERISRYSGGSTGNQVGSYQNDEVGRHRHELDDARFANPDGTVSFGNKLIVGSADPDPATVQTANHGGPETRPTNAAVLFIIKY